MQRGTKQLNEFNTIHDMLWSRDMQRRKQVPFLWGQVQAREFVSSMGGSKKK